MSRNNAGLAFKLGMFVSVIVLVFLGVIAYLFYNQYKTVEGYNQVIEGEIKIEILAEKLEINLLEMEVHIGEYLRHYKDSDIEQVHHYLEEAHKQLSELKAISDNELYERIGTLLDQYESAFLEMASLIEEKGVDENSGLQGDFREAIHTVEEEIAGYESIFVDLLTLRKHEKDYQLRLDEQKYKPLVLNQIEILKEDVSSLDLPDREKLRIYGDLDSYKTYFLALLDKENEIHAGELKMETYLEEVEPLILSFVEEAVERGDSIIIEIETTNEVLFKTMLTIVGIVTILIIIMAVIIVASIVKPIRRIVAELNNAAIQLSSAATELTATSEQIASGASEQASGLEETTSSLEELSTMVNQSTNNAVSLSQLANKSSEQSKSGLESVKDMLSSMESLNSSTDDIKNIIQVIESIAFQTNILALNAAVEAARAGDAGMGFAVVADEVKSLANKSTDSAKETGQLIQTSIDGINHNLSKAREVAELFADLENQGMKVFDMSREVEEASRQQNSGFEQINDAVIQLDQVVQMNASAAEEAASSSEELSAQALLLEESVSELVQIVDGGKVRQRQTSRASSLMLDKKPLRENSVIKGKKLETGIKVYNTKEAGKTGEKKKGEDLIPFDEEEFTDF